MNERLLQYIWQFQYFNISKLTTQEGEAIEILYPGRLNNNQGPDFLDSKIKIGDTVWAGNVELHILSTDWRNHKHSDDINYQNIILHVVWKDDAQLNLAFPVLELQNKVSKVLLEKYQTLMRADSFIPCEKSIGQVTEVIWTAWKERLLIERMQDKASVVLSSLGESGNHWEEVFWRQLAKNFGNKVNCEAFEKIAHTLPLAMLAKHKNQIHQLEALLLGQANLLHGTFDDDYCVMLQKEYKFLQKKYKLSPINIPLHYLRMRPSNFPSIRLAQLAMLVHNSSHLFSKIIAATNAKQAMQLMDVTANDYWHYHYLPDESSDFKMKKLGKQMAENIVINTLVPMLFAYGHYFNESKHKEQGLQWLEEIAAEKNSIISGFAFIGVEFKTAYDSQALIQLKNQYCNKHRCLECAVGNSILKKTL